MVYTYQLKSPRGLSVLANLDDALQALVVFQDSVRISKHPLQVRD